jgi:hypothetical protein
MLAFLGGLTGFGALREAPRRFKPGFGLSAPGFPEASILIPEIASALEIVLARRPIGASATKIPITIVIGTTTEIPGWASEAFPGTTIPGIIFPSIFRRREARAETPFSGSRTRGAKLPIPGRKIPISGRAIREAARSASTKGRTVTVFKAPRTGTITKPLVILGTERTIAIARVSIKSPEGRSPITSPIS